MDITTLFLLGLPAIPNLFGIWHAFRSEFPTSQERMIWLGVCVFVPVIGGISYLLFGFRRAKKPEPLASPQTDEAPTPEKDIAQDD